ncbi:hypothetical protein OHA18_22845 [Kribbella sp. NBC_00709]|uniref:hypothetical protein n=1 Tax=Kribbella sp. NBC_00709 TaxID=2975972 RepID=UPI002E2E3516|nr:hypothetical protein [Kribbella sp. NBC_00709]
MTAIITDLRHQVALSRAADTARQGDLAGAAALLVELDNSGDASPEVLDLLARIRAQQKNWPEADALWARVQEAVATEQEPPATEMLAGATAGRKTIAAIRARRRASRPVLPIVAGAAAIVLVAAVGVVALDRSSDEPFTQPPSSQPAPTSGTTSITPGAEERAAELARRLAALEAAQRASAATAGKELDVIQRRVAGPGVVVQREPNAVRVLFGDGLFAAGTELSSTGTTALDALGKRLQGLRAAITVTGYSVVVPGGSGSGGSRTGLLRARAATQDLSAASGLPLTAFSMQSGDQAHPPFHTDAQNRTVTVTLTPVADR